jgi:probable rRNA maturation factor
MRTTAVHVEIAWQLRQSWRAVPLLTQVAAAVAAAEGFRRGSLSIAVVGARAMATLHRRFLNLPGPTDVITFDLGTDRRARLLDGDIVVCADVAWRNARADLHSRAAPDAAPTPRSRSAPQRPARRRVPSAARQLAAARAELALYVTHGILHLAGYDDHRAADFRRMHAREDELLQNLGLGRVFAPH